MIFDLVNYLVLFLIGVNFNFVLMFVEEKKNEGQPLFFFVHESFFFRTVSDFCLGVYGSSPLPSAVVLHFRKHDDFVFCDKNYFKEVKPALFKKFIEPKNGLNIVSRF